MVEQKNIDKIAELIKNLDFNTAYNIISPIIQSDYTSAYEILFRLSDYENGYPGLLVYCFIQDKLNAAKYDVFRNHICMSIFSNHLCFLNNGYEIAIWHAEKLCELHPDDIDYWTILLDLGANRTNLFSKEKVKTIATHIIKLDPNNLKARIYLDVE